MGAGMQYTIIPRYQHPHMAQETLFRILSRQPWWVTLLVGFGIYALARVVYEPIAPFMAVPFVALSIYIGYSQWRGGAVVDVGERIVELRAMSWEEFSTAVTDAYRREGYAVAPADKGGYDFKLTKGARVTLLQCRQWKVSQVGAAPVRELAKAIDRDEAYNGICIMCSDFTAPARELATKEPITLVSGRELVELVGGGKKSAAGLDLEYPARHMSRLSDAGFSRQIKARRSPHRRGVAGRRHDRIVHAATVQLRAAVVPSPPENTSEHAARHAHGAPARMSWARLTPARLRHRYRALLELWRRPEDHRRHRRSGGDRQDPHASGLACPGAAALPGAVAGAVPGGLILGQTRFCRSANDLARPALARASQTASK